MNRKKLLLLNTIVVLATTFVNIVFGMLEVKLLIEKYGASINGLIQTGNQFLVYIALLEAGISASYLYSLYKPIAENDNEKISELYCGFRISLNHAILKMMGGACIVSMIYPIFLNKDGLTYGYMASIFVLLSAKAILPYFLIYVPKYMIIAKEQRYKAELITCISKAVTYSTEIGLMLFTNVSLHILLASCIIISTVSGVVYRWVMKKLYGGQLSNKAKPDTSPRKMSRDVLVHNLSGLIFNSTGNIILSIFCPLNVVTIYSNYNMIVNQVIAVFQSIYDGITASLGIKIAHRDSNSYDVYRELLVITLFCSCLIGIVFVVMINEFIALWVGGDYCLSSPSCYLFGIIISCGTFLPCINAARNACGLYKESKGFTLIQMVVNLAIAIVLTPKWGITGAILGTAVARVVVSVPCNYLLVDKKVFSDHKSKWSELLVALVVTIGITIGSQLLYKVIDMNKFINNDFFAFIVNALCITLVAALALVTVFSAFSKDFRKIITKYMHKIRWRKV